MKLVFLFFLSLFTCAFYDRQCKVCGEYRFYNDDRMYYQSLKIFNDHTYYYEIGNDLIAEKSTGNWKLYRDTLLLNSAFKSDGFELAVNEIVAKKKDKQFNFFDVNQKDFYPLGIALFGDSSEYIQLDTHVLNLPVKNIKSFELVLSNNLISKRYYIKNQSANKLDIFLPSNEIFDNYLFITDKKMVLKNRKLISLNSNNKIDSILHGFNTFKPIELKKVKRNSRDLH